MTKEQLQRRYEFLLLQMKVINQLAEMQNLSDNERAQNMGAITYYSKASTIKSQIEFIESYDEKYNFYHKTMNIDDYKN